MSAPYGDAGNRGAFPVSGVDTPGGVRWRFDTAHPVAGALVRDADLLFVGDLGGTVTALAADSGAVRWQWTVEGPRPVGQQRVFPVGVLGDRVFIVDTAREVLVACDRGTGALIGEVASGCSAAAVLPETVLALNVHVLQAITPGSSARRWVTDGGFGFLAAPPWPTGWWWRRWVASRTAARAGWSRST